MIASGPTVPDPSTFSDCLEIITRYGLAEKLPPQVCEFLKHGRDGLISETPKGGDDGFQTEIALLSQKGLSMIHGAKFPEPVVKTWSDTYAFRSGVPIEIVSTVILRHANLSTTQHYLGKISDTEATSGLKICTGNPNEGGEAKDSPSASVQRINIRSGKV